MDPSEVEFKPKKNWFSAHMFLGIVFLIAVAGAVVSGIYYYQTVNGLNTSPVLPSHKTETANWKTYTNAQYGFSFQYPNDWQLKDKSNLSASFFSGFNNITITNDATTGESESIEFISGPNQDTGADTGDKGPANIVGGATWETYDAVTGLGDQSRTLSLLTFHNNQYFVIEIYPNNDLTITNPIVTQILSTFKFTDSTSVDTSTWKTYTNDQYGFSFKYPSDWEINLDPDGVGFISAQTKKAMQNPDYEGSVDLLINYQSFISTAALGSIEPQILNGNKFIYYSGGPGGIENGNYEIQSGESTLTFTGDPKVLKPILSTFKFTK